MSQPVVFSDQDLQAAIVAHFKEQGVTINEDTARQLTQEVRRKLKKSTDDELKLALSEMKMELSPTISSSNSSYLHAHSVVNTNANIYNIVNSAFKNMTRDDVTQAMAQLAQAANTNGKTLKEQRNVISKEIHNAQRNLSRVETKIKSISGFDEESEAERKQILELIDDDNLQKITEKEHSALGKTRASKDSESKRVGYTPQEIKALNRSFSPSRKDAEGNVVQEYTNNLPTLSFGEVGENRSNERLLWTRKRFAFERALGRENEPLYAKRVTQYRTYIAILMHERLVLGQLIASKQRLIIATGKIAEQTQATQAIEHFHYDAEKGKNINFLQLKNLLSAYVEGLRQAENNYLLSLKDVKVTDEEMDDVENEINEFLNSLNAGTEPEAYVQRSSEKATFEPEYVYSQARQGRTNDQDESAKFRQEGKLAPNDWSFKNIEQHAPEVAAKIEKEPTTWRKGWAIFNWGDKPSKATKTDVGTILKPKISPKITQTVQLSPYATDKEKEFVINNINRFNTTGLDEGSKLRMANGPWHWAILWNLSKDKISKQTFMSELFGKRNDLVNLPDGVQALAEEVYKQYPKVNPEAVRMEIAKNDATPDWILMYMAQHDRDLESFVLNKLGQRGWRVKKTAEGNPEIHDGDWVWSRVKKSSLRMGFREAQVQTTEITPTQENPQLQQLINQQNGLNNQDQNLQQQRKQLQDKMNKIKNQQPIPQTPQTTSSQAMDSTTAIPGAITPPTMASENWKLLVSTWRNKILGR